MMRLSVCDAESMEKKGCAEHRCSPATRRFTARFAFHDMILTLKAIPGTITGFKCLSIMLDQVSRDAGMECRVAVVAELRCSCC